jgi:hypothetical protein
MYRKGKEYSAIADLQISEGALHPLSREKDSLVKEKAMKQIVKMAPFTSRTATIVGRSFLRQFPNVPIN